MNSHTRLCPRPGDQLWFFCIIAAAGSIFHCAASESDVVLNGDFESDTGATIAQSIPGWTTYGTSTSAIAVVSEPASPDGLALRISEGKAFGYDLPIRPEADYVLKVRVRADNATARIEIDPAMGVRGWSSKDEHSFGWRAVEVKLPAAGRAKSAQSGWIALGSQATKPGGESRFDDVRLEPMSGGRDSVSNGSFAQPILTMTNPSGWIQHIGGADVRLDPFEPLTGRSSLHIAGRGRPVRIVQTIDLSAMKERGTKRVRVVASGRCVGLTNGSVKFIVQGVRVPLPPVFCVTGNLGWTSGQVAFDLDQLLDRRITLSIDSSQPLTGHAWIDGVRVEEIQDHETVNLLWNAGFQQALNNSRLPDYWGLYGNAVLCVEPWSLDYFGIDERVPSPVPETRVLRIHHPRRGSFVPIPPSDRLSLFLPHGGEISPATHQFTFSVYVKAAQPGTPIQFRHPAAQAGAPRTIGTSWERIAISGTNPGHLASLHLPNPGSLVWIAAPQLELGTKPTKYTASQGQKTSGSKPVQLPPIDNASVLPPRVESTDRLHEQGNPMVEAFADYDLYTSAARGRGRIRWSGTTAVDVTGRLIDVKTGDIVASRLFALAVDAKHEQQFDFDIASLRSGHFAIQTIALAGGRKVGRALDTFRIARNARNPVCCSRVTRSVIVDGRPFFPIFMPVELAELGDWHLERMAWAGFNTIIAAPGRLNYIDVAQNGLAPVDEAELRRRLDQLHAQGMRFVWPLSWSFKGWEGIEATHRGNISPITGAVRQVVSGFRDHPAIIGWYLVDEPAPGSWESRFGFRESDLAMLHDVVKDADPARPCYVNWNHTWNFEPYGGLGCTDLISHDNYSISDAPFDLETLVPAVRMLNDNRAGRKPAWAWISGSFDEAKVRPNADAVRVHAWLHLVYGTRGLGYWSRPPLDPDVWTEMRSINHNAIRLQEDVFGRDDARQLVVRSNTPGVHYAIWKLPRRAYVLGINTTGGPTSFRLDLPIAIGTKPVAIRELFAADARLKNDPAVLSATIPAFGRFAYEIHLPDSATER